MIENYVSNANLSKPPFVKDNLGVMAYERLEM